MLCFFGCFPAQERSSLQKAVKELDAKKNGSKCRILTITVQHLNVTSKQKAEIKKLCEREFFTCSTCIHAVSRILQKSTGIAIPFPVNQLPLVSLEYLTHLQKNGDRQLCAPITHGTAQPSFTRKVHRCTEKSLVTLAGCCLDKRFDCSGNFVENTIDFGFGFSKKLTTCNGLTMLTNVIFFIRRSL